MRSASIKRKTQETDISVKVNIDGSGNYNIKTPLPFMTHMLEQLSKHSLIDLNIDCKGDIEIDAHHTVEDLGWALGEALKKSLKQKKGIYRYSSINLPMDETLTTCSIDVSGRPWLVWKVILSDTMINNINTEVFKEFFQAFSQSSNFTINIINQYGSNTHHVIESCFKSLAICLRNSLAIDNRNYNAIPSTKGII